MNKILIVNADDFGLSKAQNYGIIEAFNHGIVTSTTAMMNGAAAEHAVALSKAYPKLAVGMHFVLTLGKPLSAMPHLVNAQGELDKGIWQRAEADTLPLEEIQQELCWQFARFIQLFGRAPTHIDSHHHVHMLPQVFSLVEAFAQEKGVAIRIDRQVVKARGISLQGAKSTQAFTSDFYGEAISEALLLETLDRATAQGVQSLEMMCHPAFIDRTLLNSAYCWPRLDELQVLTSPSLKYAIAERGYRLRTFADL